MVTNDDLLLFFASIQGDVKKMNELLDIKNIKVDPPSEPITFQNKSMDSDLRDYLKNQMINKTITMNVLDYKLTNEQPLNDETIHVLKRISKMSDNNNNKYDIVLRNKYNNVTRNQDTYKPDFYEIAYSFPLEMKSITGPISMYVFCNKSVLPSKFYLFGDVHKKNDDIFSDCISNPSTIGYLPNVLKHIFIKNNTSDYVMDIFVEHRYNKEKKQEYDLKFCSSGLINNIAKEFNNCIVDLTDEKRELCSSMYKKTRFHFADARRYFKLEDMTRLISKEKEYMDKQLKLIDPKDIKKRNGVAKQYIILNLINIITNDDLSNVRTILYELISTSIMGAKQLQYDPAFIKQQIEWIILKSHPKIHKYVLQHENILKYVNEKCDQLFNIYTYIIHLYTLRKTDDNELLDENKKYFDALSRSFSDNFGLAIMDTYLLVRVFKTYVGKKKYPHDIISPTTRTNFIIAGEDHIQNYKTFLENNGYHISFSSPYVDNICHQVDTHVFDIESCKSLHSEYYANIIMTQIFKIKEIKSETVMTSTEKLLLHVSTLTKLDLSNLDLVHLFYSCNWLFELINTHHKNGIKYISVSKSVLDNYFMLILSQFAISNKVEFIDMSHVVYDINNANFELYFNFGTYLTHINLSGCNIISPDTLLMHYISSGHTLLRNINLSNNGIQHLSYNMLHFIQLLMATDNKNKLTIDLSNNLIDVGDKHKNITVLKQINKLNTTIILTGNPIHDKYVLRNKDSSEIYLNIKK